MIVISPVPVVPPVVPPVPVPPVPEPPVAPPKMVLVPEPSQGAGMVTSGMGVVQMFSPNTSFPTAAKVAVVKQTSVMTVPICGFLALQEMVYLLATSGMSVVVPIMKWLPPFSLQLALSVVNVWTWLFMDCIGVVVNASATTSPCVWLILQSASKGAPLRMVFTERDTLLFALEKSLKLMTPSLGSASVMVNFSVSKSMTLIETSDFLPSISARIASWLIPSVSVIVVSKYFGGFGLSKSDIL